MNYGSDKRIVLTLDGGGTHFRFCAIRGNRPVVKIFPLPAEGHDLKKCLANLQAGFAKVKQQCPRPPVAISFAFPGPADYPSGIIGDLCNLPAFRGGVPLGPMLEKEFRLPVFINNDAGLFAYGEAIAGWLPHLNGRLEKLGSSKRYRNLCGVTLGTGFGCGIIRQGELCLGDNSNAGHIWLLRNKLNPLTNAEEGVSVRAVRRVYAEQAGIPLNQAPNPRDIHKIAVGRAPGHRAAAREAYRQMAVVAGDAIAALLALVDGLVVLGGGLANAWKLFLPFLLEELTASYADPTQDRRPRLAAAVLNLQDPKQLRVFLRRGLQLAAGRGGRGPAKLDTWPRLGVAITRLGTSQAVAIGAYAFALKKLDAL